MRDALVAAGCPEEHCTAAIAHGIPASVFVTGIKAGWSASSIITIFKTLLALSANKDVQAAIDAILAIFQHAPAK